MKEIIEVQKFYKIGYRAGFKNAILLAMKAKNSCGEEMLLVLDKLIFDMLERYNEYPLISKMEMQELEKENNNGS